MSECKSTPISTTHCMSSLPMHSLRSLDTQTQIATPFLTNHQITNLTGESHHLYLGRPSRKKSQKLWTESVRSCATFFLKGLPQVLNIWEREIQILYVRCMRGYWRCYNLFWLLSRAGCISLNNCITSKFWLQVQKLIQHRCHMFQDWLPPDTAPRIFSCFGFNVSSHFMFTFIFS